MCYSLLLQREALPWVCAVSLSSSTRPLRSGLPHARMTVSQSCYLRVLGRVLSVPVQDDAPGTLSPHPAPVQSFNREAHGQELAWEATRVYLIPSFQWGLERVTLLDTKATR